MHRVCSMRCCSLCDSSTLRLHTNTPCLCIRCCCRLAYLPTPTVLVAARCSCCCIASTMRLQPQGPCLFCIVLLQAGVSVHTHRAGGCMCGGWPAATQTHHVLCCCYFCCRLAYLSTPTVLVAACVVGGLLEALTPLSIITGAIMLFQTMQHTKVSPRQQQRRPSWWARFVAEHLQG